MLLGRIIILQGRLGEAIPERLEQQLRLRPEGLKQQLSLRLEGLEQQLLLRPEGLRLHAAAPPT